MEEAESPTESVQEDIHHAAEHSRDRWTMGVALSSSILAALAAVSSLLSGHRANEAMILQIQASNQWNYYQAKGIKAAILGSKLELSDDGTSPDGPAKSPIRAKDEAKLAKYAKDQEEIKAEAARLTHESEESFHLHEILSRGVTLFQVAISIAAISALTRRKRFWWVAMGFGVCGLYFLISALLQS